MGGGGGSTGAQQGGSTGAAAVGLLEGQVASLREQLSSVATSAGIASLAHAADLASASSAHAAQVWQGRVGCGGMMEPNADLMGIITPADTPHHISALLARAPVLMAKHAGLAPAAKRGGCRR